jgi:hypothetical protein
MSEKLKGIIRIFACGGAGINIASQLEKFRNNEEVGVAKLEISYIDTSRSNLSTNVPEGAVYLLKDLDGSGKIRKENYQQIAAHTRDILQRHEPLDLSVVISSASGGSGSVIAPSIVSELLERDTAVVVILIGASDTRLDVDNSLKTIKSYEAISKLRGKPVVVKYMQNSSATPRGQVDSEVLQTISALLTAYSRENSELDSKDLFNFLNFHRATTFAAQLSALNTYFGEFPVDHAGEVISVVTLCEKGGDSSLSITPDYQAVGFMPEGVNDRLVNAAPINLVITTDLMAHAAKALSSKLQELEQIQRARISTPTILTDKDNATDNGLVL